MIAAEVIEWRDGADPRQGEPSRSPRSCPTAAGRGVGHALGHPAHVFGPTVPGQALRAPSGVPRETSGPDVPRETRGVMGSATHRSRVPARQPLGPKRTGRRAPLPRPQRRRGQCRPPAWPPVASEPGSSQVFHVEQAGDGGRCPDQLPAPLLPAARVATCSAREVGSHRVFRVATRPETAAGALTSYQHPFCRPPAWSPVASELGSDRVFHVKQAGAAASALTSYQHRSCRTAV